MESDARERTRRGAVCRAMGVVLVFLCAACRAPAPELPVSERIPLPDSVATTLAVAPDGRLWLGAPGTLRVLEPGGATVRMAPAAAAPRPLAIAGGWALLDDGDTLRLLEEATLRAVGATAASAAVHLDVRGRWLFTGAASGAVMIHEPDSLRLIAAWPSAGRPATAITGSPEGDRVYLALGGESATVLTRDLQTGRVLRSDDFAAPFASLAADSAGNLYGVVGGEGDAALLSLRPWGPQLELRWRVRTPGGAEARLILDPGGRRLALLVPGANENGLRVYDAEAGDLLGTLPEPPLDAAFDPAGRLLLLYPGEIRVVDQ